MGRSFSSDDGCEGRGFGDGGIPIAGRYNGTLGSGLGREQSGLRSEGLVDGLVGDHRVVPVNAEGLSLAVALIVAASEFLRLRPGHPSEGRSVALINGRILEVIEEVPIYGGPPGLRGTVDVKPVGEVGAVPGVDVEAFIQVQT